MATKFTQIVGQPFSKPVRAEFERRRSLDQNYDTISELYQPYFKIRRLKSLRPVTAMEEPNDNDYMDGRFSSLGKVYEEGEYDIGYGMDSLEEDSELKGYPAITSVTFELEDFTFYRATINFEIPDVTYFQEFREKWLQFGAPIEMQWGRYSPVEFEEDSNEDMLPNLEKRMGNVVKFDYGMDGGGKEITGTLTVYSVTWLPVLQEGTSEGFETEEFQELLKQYYRRSVTSIFFEATNEEEFRDLFWATDKHDQTRNFSLEQRESLFQAVRVSRERSGVTDTTGENEDNGEGYITIEDRIYDLVAEKKVKNIEKKINSFFTLNEREFGTSTYYFISLRTIEIFLNKILNYNTNKKVRGNFEGELFKYDLTNCIINDFSIRGISSRSPDRVLINPRNNFYNIDDEGDFLKTANGQYAISGDIFISALDFFQIIDNSKSGYSLVSDILSLIKDATGSMIDLEQKRENGEISQGNVIINGMGLIDSSTIRDNETGNYQTFELHHPKEKIQNVSLNTEIADDISNMIFFKSRGEFNSEESIDLNEIFLFSNQLNMRHFLESISRKYSDTINNAIKSINSQQVLPSHGTMEKARQSLKLEDIADRFDIDINELGDLVIKSDEGQSDLDEIYNARKDLLNKIERKFESVGSNIKQRKLSNADSMEISENIGKDYLYNLLTFLYIYFSQTVELHKTEYYTKNNFRMPYTISFEVDGIAGIIPSQAFKVDLGNFPVEFNDNESALFVVTGLSHTFEGNSWVTAINGSFWIDFQKNTFLNRYDKDGIGGILTGEYRNIISALKLIFERKVLKDLEKDDESIIFLREADFESFASSDEDLHKSLGI